ncbi:MAG TPA: DNA-processing protein DprA [Acidimicrobiales bacterium]|nr:DNA-processing protein DprA [Acidimicrobiales bacterium]
MSPDHLPLEAYATALASLPAMGPARLAALLGTVPPDVAWRRLVRARPGGEHDPGQLLGLGPGEDDRVRRALGPAGAALAGRWRTAAASLDVAALWRRTADLGMTVTRHGAAGYPAPLVDDVEPPAVAFHVGDPAVLDAPKVAVVGTRRCSATGRSVAAELGRDLATAGVVVVSGLASGIDGAAHRGALAAEAAPPVGVVGSGLDVVYPADHQDLWQQVPARGLLLSEAPPGSPPERWRFPARNRIIAALADVVVVVESHRRGGALHTVDEADRRATDVFAVPGSVRNPAAAGTNDLLAEGRPPACSADDVLVALGLGAGRRQGVADRRPAPGPDDASVLEHVGWQPTSLDQLALRAGRDLPTLAPALERLCQGGWVDHSGGWYQRVGPVPGVR